ncbi:polysaccharide biosynthesis/export family protein [Thioclava sp. SK-1]|uniref:polysaccharide biosynthesis/export family protein n=1 Tax=Thioclava sp. SK-1 TaxID=1889770 RepID=UPI0021012046|nr:polysaccharide biosynthesis/export family protein [Thioclava sp. SK-1]
MSREVLASSGDENAPFQVVRVSHDNINALRAWPDTSGSDGHGWLPAGQGSSSGLIRTGDLITLRIWDNSETPLLSGPAAPDASITGLQVTSGGAVFVPYVGEVRVAGLTAAAARARVEKALTEFVASPQVQLSVTPGRQNAVNVVSGVGKPGQYPLLDRNSTVLAVLSEAGGVSPSLNNPVLRLIRGRNTYEIRTDRLFSEASFDALVTGGDRIIVEEDARFFTALGASGQETSVTFPRDDVSVMEAMTLIGGLNDARADPKGVLVLREYTPDQLSFDEAGPQKTEAVFVFDLTSADGLFAARKFPIYPGDTVLSTESPVASVRTIFGLLGSLVGISNNLN